MLAFMTLWHLLVTKEMLTSCTKVLAYKRTNADAAECGSGLLTSTKAQTLTLTSTKAKTLTLQNAGQTLTLRNADCGQTLTLRNAGQAY